jgi:hypothetical protein
VTAGRAYATTWLAALGVRLGFAYGCTHWFAGPLDARADHITATTYAATFVLMVRTVVTVRTAALIRRKALDLPGQRVGATGSPGLRGRPGRSRTIQAAPFAVCRQAGWGGPPYAGGCRRWCVRARWLTWA